MRTQSLHWAQLLPRETARFQLQQIQELTKAIFLIAYQMPRLRKHSFNHLSCLRPVTFHACLHEFFARPCARAVTGNNLCDHWSQLMDYLHVWTSLCGSAPKVPNPVPRTSFPMPSLAGTATPERSRLG